MEQLAATLDESELDQLKLILSSLCIRKLENRFDLSSDPVNREKFYDPLRQLSKIQPFSSRLRPYGIFYLGRPNFMTDALVENLRAEAESFRAEARFNFNHYLYQVETIASETCAEKLYESPVFGDFIESHAGPCLKSFITSYIYYDQAGRSSEPHVDNAFTSVTAMVGLRHECKRNIFSSRSVFFWPDKERLEIQLKPGEIVVFAGVSAVHGRTPVAEDEKVHSLLLSFRPDLRVKNN
jgi:hypothetical protein